MKHLFLLLIFFTFISCSKTLKPQLSEKTIPVIIKQVSNGKIYATDSTTITVRKIDSIQHFLIGLKKFKKYETSIESFKLNLQDKSKLLINNKEAVFISKKTFITNTEKCLVRKYYYNEQNVIDEEGYYYITNDRIIVFLSEAWNLAIIYEYQDNELLELLKADSSNFFDYHVGLW